MRRRTRTSPGQRIQDIDGHRAVPLVALFQQSVRNQVHRRFYRRKKDIAIDFWAIFRFPLLLTGFREISVDFYRVLLRFRRFVLDFKNNNWDYIGFLPSYRVSLRFFWRFAPFYFTFHCWSMGLTRSYRISSIFKLGFNVFFTEFSCDFGGLPHSSGFTGFYWVLTGFYWVLLGFTGFYWV